MLYTLTHRVDRLAGSLTGREAQHGSVCHVVIFPLNFTSILVARFDPGPSKVGR